MKDMKKALEAHAAKPASEAHKGLKRGGMTGYAAGGMPMVTKDGKKVPSFAADGKGKMAKGGSIDGCAKKGKTKGTMIKMAMGGKTC